LAERLAAQTGVPIEFWGWAGEVPIEIKPPHSMLVIRRFPRPALRGAWAFAQLGTHLRAAKSGVRAVHITDPEALAPLRGKVVMTTSYDLIPFIEGIRTRQLITWAGYRLYLRNLRLADHVFAISTQTADDLVCKIGVPPSIISLARPGIDLRQLRVTGPISGSPYFLYVGGPNPNKNLGTLLGAMAMVGDLPHHLLLAGPWLPKDVASLDAMVDGSVQLRGRVRHLGYVTDTELASLIQGATALVLPSYREGFGLPVAEGLALGALVIHSRIPVLMETSAGAALTFDPNSRDELVACLREAAGNAPLMGQLRDRARARSQLLTWDRTLESTLAVYRTKLWL
jgi:glycosyltransferase involved in cell wall biosynthesis